MTKKNSFNTATLNMKRYRGYTHSNRNRSPRAPALTASQLKKLVRAYQENPNSDYIKTMESQYSDLIALRQIFGVDDMIRRMNLAVERDKFRPRNLRILDFAALPDLKTINGEFSTFDIKLSREFRRYQYGKYLEYTADLPNTPNPPPIDTLEKLINKLETVKYPWTDEFVKSTDEKYPKLKFLRWAFDIDRDEYYDASYVVYILKQLIKNYDKYPKDIDPVDLVARPVISNTFIENSPISGQQIRETTLKNITNAHETVVGYRQIWMNVLEKHPRYVQQLIDNARNMPLAQMTMIFRIFIRDVMEIMGINFPNMHVWVVDDWNKLPRTAPKNLIGEGPKNNPFTGGGQRVYRLQGDDDTLHAAIIIKRSAYTAKIQKNNLNLFVTIIGALAHEYGHFVDRAFHDHHGMLGAQTERIDFSTYVNHHDNPEQYFKSATEFSSYEIGGHLTQAIKQKYQGK